MKGQTFKWLVGCLLLIALIAAACWTLSRPAEPSWNGRSLSGWLEAYDNHNRFGANDPRGRPSPLGEDEIQLALQEMRQEALPVLLHWLRQTPSRLKPRLNSWLNQQHFLQARFDDEDYRILACTGFMAYGTEAHPVLPELLELSRSTDPDMRMMGYQSAFFTRPERSIFLALARQALQENDERVRAMTECWMGERFPDEAEVMLSKLGDPVEREL